MSCEVCFVARRTIASSPLPSRGGPAVGGQGLVDRPEIECRCLHHDERLVFAGAMFPLPHEPGHRVAAQGLRVAAHAPQQAAVGCGDDPPADLGHGADRQLPLANGHLPDLDVDSALGSDARDPILGVLGEWAADDVPPVVDPVDDQPAVGHGHGRDGVANVFRDAALEVEPLVFEAAEQAPELVDCEPPGDVAESGDGGHDGKDYQIFQDKKWFYESFLERLSNFSRPSPRRFPVVSDP